jgi:hypothetical protein
MNTIEHRTDDMMTSTITMRMRIFCKLLYSFVPCRIRVRERWGDKRKGGKEKKTNIRKEQRERK